MKNGGLTMEKWWFHYEMYSGLPREMWGVHQCIVEYFLIWFCFSVPPSDEMCAPIGQVLLRFPILCC